MYITDSFICCTDCYTILFYPENLISEYDNDMWAYIMYSLHVIRLEPYRRHLIWTEAEIIPAS